MAVKLGKMVAAVAAVTLVGAGAAWYTISGRIVDETTAFLQTYGSASLPGGGSYKVSYERIGRASFPSIGVRIVNPGYRFDLPGDDAEKSPPVKFTIQVNGVADTITDYLSSGYHLKISGISTITADVGEEHIVATSTPDVTEAFIKAKNRHAFGSWEKLDWSNSQQLLAALKDVEQIRFDGGVSAYKDANGNLMFGSEKTVFNFTNRSADIGVDFDLGVEIKAMESGQAYLDVVHRIMQSFTPASSLTLGDMPFSSARAGKQDVELALSVNLPQGLAAGVATGGSIHLSKFNLKNNYYTLSAPTDLVLAEADGQRNVKVKLDWLLDVTPAGGLEGARLVDMIAGMAPPASADAPLDPAVLKEKITQALPTLSTLGPIRLALDSDTVAPMPTAGGAPGAAKHDAVTLREFAFTHKRWGLAAKGESLNDESGAKINVNLTCTLCDSLTGDLFATAQAAQDVINLSAPNRPQWPLTPELLAQLNATLAEIGSKDASGTISFAFTTPKPGDVAVNGKPMAEVLPKLMAVFAAAQPVPAQPPVEAELPAQPPAPPAKKK